MEKIKSKGMETINLMCLTQGTDVAVVYDQASLLLKTYRKVVLANKMFTREDMLWTFGDHDRETVRRGFLKIAKYNPKEDREELERLFYKVLGSNWLLHIVRDIMNEMKEFPIHGITYYDIIEKTYFHPLSASDDDVIEATNMTRSLYYLRRKEAITLFGLFLWRNAKNTSFDSHMDACLI